VKARVVVATLIGLVLVVGTFLALSHQSGTRPPAPATTNSPTSKPTAGPTSTPTVPLASKPHILIIMEENQGYNATQTNCGSSNAYFCQLASEYASVVPWYGVYHPSLPNYLAATSGSTQGCASDGCLGPYPVNNLGNQLSQAGIPWTAYMESMPSACYTGSSSGEYAQKHDPFVYYADILNGGGCASHVVPYPGAAGLVSALSGTNAPDFVWITPNLIDDLHDGTVAAGNAWLQANLGPVLSSAWFTDFNSTVIVTEDENDAQSLGSCCGDASGGQVPELVISGNAKGKGIVSLTGDLYGTLRTIEEAYGLALLGAAANSANGDLTPLFG
jgi:acid phosphatase